MEYWGEFPASDKSKKQVICKEEFLAHKKVEKYGRGVSNSNKAEEDENLCKSKNSSKESFETEIVTQTMDLMDQKEMLQNLLSSQRDIKSEFNQNNIEFNEQLPCIEYHNPNNLIKEERYATPFWFIPPIKTDFTRGVPKKYEQLSKTKVTLGLRKSIAGLLKIKGFNNTTETCLSLFVDSVDEFYKNIHEHLDRIFMNEYRDQKKVIDILTLERAYFSLTNSSLLNLHNYYRNEIIQRNKRVRNEYDEVYEEYENLRMKCFKIKQENCLSYPTNSYDSDVDIQPQSQQQTM